MVERFYHGARLEEEARETLMLRSDGTSFFSAGTQSVFGR
jgi:hypothetical protein